MNPSMNPRMAARFAARSSLVALTAAVAVWTSSGLVHAESSAPETVNSAAVGPAHMTGSADTGPPSDSAARVHQHDGFYLKLQGGFGHRSIEAANTTISGGGAGVGLLIGGAIAKNLILHGEVTSAVASDPTIEIDGESIETENTNVSTVGFGPGATYYIMPLNAYVGASLLLSKVSVEFDRETIAESEMGFGGVLRAGKEFWVGDDWGLGVGGEFQFGSASEKDMDERIFSSAFTVNVGATYN